MQNRNQNLNGGRPGPKASWGDWGQPPPHTAAETGGRSWAERVSQQDSPWQRAAGCCPVQQSGAMGSPTHQHSIPLGAEPKHPRQAPPCPLCPWLCFAVPLSPCSACCCRRHRTTPPPRPGSPPAGLPSCLALCLLPGRFRFPEPLSGARVSWKAGFLDTALSNAGRETSQAELMGLKIAQHRLLLSAFLSYNGLRPKNNPKSKPVRLNRAITTKSFLFFFAPSCVLDIVACL